jgi:hypothetical protein
MNFPELLRLVHFTTKSSLKNTTPQSSKVLGLQLARSYPLTQLLLLKEVVPARKPTTLQKIICGCQRL